MAEKLNLEQVRHVAQLAHIGLSQEEIEKFQKQLGAILEFVGKLQKVNTQNTKPLSQTTGLKNVFRGDEINPSFSQEQALANAPERYQNYFKVKAVLIK
jgi:aspartyl-tRNA(Asn)/glutamyl-tRNA(Gln) amidotransferase subunit C